MGLADRFSDSLETKDIFKTTKKEVSVVLNPIKRSRNFDDLETEIIDKIRKTPYWSEYSTSEKKNMIAAYFCCKLKDRSYSAFEREEFVQDILVLSNNK